MFVWLPVLLDSSVDVLTISSVIALLFLSSVSLFFIFQLRFRSKVSPKLHHFNSLWAIRFLLVIFIFLWSLSQLLRHPSFFTSLSLSLSSQVYFCKFHIVLSLGLLQPAFLVILLYLVIVSIRKPNSKNSLCAVSLVLIVFPVVLLQSFFLFFWDGNQLPDIFVRSWSVADPDSQNDVVSCTYPLISIVIFGGFAMTYAVGFMVSSYRVVSLVINKGLRRRIYFLTFVVLFSLATETVCLVFSAAWRMETSITGLIPLLAFLSALLVAVAGEAIVVIRPISDALAATGCSSQRGDYSSDQAAEV
ncbi:hypothetical protein RJ641_033659 [Dillenia turbinata]|uniref:Uncharacterized protein n=1 Tax=Dillenia turbinata TaxID=194707 RepID=A0AAN8ZDH9_9MAGN